MRQKRDFFPSSPHLWFFLNTSGLLPAPTAEHETVVMSPPNLPLPPSPFKWFIHLFALPCIFGPTALRWFLKNFCWHLIWKLPPLHQYLYMWCYKNIPFALMYCSFLTSHSSRKHKGRLAGIRNPTDIISMQWHSQKV